jgi:hypothetical protein
MVADVITLMEKRGNNTSISSPPLTVQLTTIDFKEEQNEQLAMGLRHTGTITLITLKTKIIGINSPSTSRTASVSSINALEMDKQLASSSSLPSVSHSSTSLNQTANMASNDSFSSQSPRASITGSNITLPDKDLVAQTGASLAAFSDQLKEKRKIPGRVQKLTGDWYLLIGCWSRAMACYQIAIENTKNVSDNIWCAAAMEGFLAASLLHLWSESDSSPAAVCLLS